MIEALEGAVDRYEQLGQLNGAAQAQFQLAEIHRLQHEHIRAVQLYSLAYERFKKTGDPHGMATCLRGIGIAYFQGEIRGEIVNAQKTCSDEYTCITNSERNLGRVYRDRSSTGSTRPSTKARRHYMTHGPRRDAAIALIRKS